MKIVLLALAATAAACTNNPPAPGTIGPADVTYKELPFVDLHLDSAWAFPVPEGYIVSFASGEQGVACPEPGHIVDEKLELDVFTQNLTAGDVPIVSWDSNLYDHAPPSTVAAFMQVDTGAKDPVGKLTVIQPDTRSIAGKIDLQTSDGAGGQYQISGEFEAYMCQY